MSGDLAFASIPELAQRLRSRKLSPVALAEHALERLETLGPRYNALVTLTRERCLEQARRAERALRRAKARGTSHSPLLGIPYGAKDLLATGGGIPTSWGLGSRRSHRFDDDAAVIERLAEAGAPLAAKLAMVELAGGLKYDQANASFTGPGINPWNPEAWTGGSSTGSGAAVAAGLVPFAIGSETWGSITSPAAFCGVTGLRPTLGRVSRRGAMALSWTLDKVGPLCRTAEDCGIVLQAIAGHDPLDAASLHQPFRFAKPRARGRRLRLATLQGADDTSQPEVRENFRRALQVLREVADIMETTLPPYPYTEITSLIMFSEASAALDGLLGDADFASLTAEESRSVPIALRAIPARDYLNALRLRQRAQRDVTAWFGDFDAIVTPTHKLVAPPLNQRFSDYFGPHRRQEITTVGNLLGLPALSVPNGFGPRGLPTALQFVGKPLSENLLIALGSFYQGRTEWHRARPPVFQTQRNKSLATDEHR
jgi:aspartyl-tRNA(Asn)/glutamyl-tRNA(Gln) amidotransferase subunit A